LVLTVFANRA